MAAKGSAAGFVAKRPDHLLSEGRRWPPKDQQQVCSKETRSLTNWRQEMATKGSAAGFVEKIPDHLLSEGRRWPPKGQQQVLQQRDQITYFLWAGDGHQRVSSRFCSKETRSLTP